MLSPRSLQLQRDEEEKKPLGLWPRSGVMQGWLLSNREEALKAGLERSDKKE